MLDRMHMRRHHDNWLHWIRRVSRDVDEHYAAALRADEMYWPEFTSPENSEEVESSTRTSLVKFYSHRAVIESIPGATDDEGEHIGPILRTTYDDDEEEEEEESDHEEASYSGIGIVRIVRVLVFENFNHISNFTSLLEVLDKQLALSHVSV